MRILIDSLAVLGLVAALTTTAVAQSVKQFQLVGMTEDTFQGDTGVLGFTQACQAEFPASRMCSSEEVITTVVIPGLPTGFGSVAWVRPSYRPYQAEDSGRPAFLDVSGYTANTAYDYDAGNFSCAAWTTNGTAYYGLTFRALDNRFDVLRCDSELRVACCSLIPVPEPPTALLQGAAAATLGTIATKRAPARRAPPLRPKPPAPAASTKPPS